MAGRPLRRARLNPTRRGWDNAKIEVSRNFGGGYLVNEIEENAHRYPIVSNKEQESDDVRFYVLHDGGSSHVYSGTLSIALSKVYEEYFRGGTFEHGFGGRAWRTTGNAAMQGAKPYGVMDINTALLAQSSAACAVREILNGLDRSNYSIWRIDDDNHGLIFRV